MKQRITWEDTTIVVSYPSIGKEFRGNAAELPPEVFQDCLAARHGLAQKLGDAASGGSPSEKWEAVQGIWTSLKAGEWARRPGRSLDEDLVREAFLILALAKGHTPKVAEKSATELTKKFYALPPDGQKAIKEKAAFKAALDKARAERRIAAIARAEEDDFDL